MEESERKDILIARAFREHGYKATPQRIAICRYALNSTEHCTAHRIHLEVRKEYPTVSISTIYTTLNILKEAGMIQELCRPCCHARYDPNIEPHMHLVCEQCGSISDWNEPLIPEVLKSVANDADFIINESCLSINGVCKECHNGNNKINDRER